MDYRDTLNKMKRALVTEKEESPEPQEKPSPPAFLCRWKRGEEPHENRRRANRSHRHVKKREIEIFTTSLYEIDRIRPGMMIMKYKKGSLRSTTIGRMYSQKKLRIHCLQIVTAIIR
jgi:hypothetical protein